LIHRLVSIIKETARDVTRLVRSPAKGFKAFFNVSLYRNASYLMLNNIIMQATGFFFWMAAARLYSAEAVGLSSAVISAMLLLSTLSYMGMDYSLIRFLPGAGSKASDMINTCFTIGGVTSIVLALVFMAGLNLWSPALVSIRQNPLFLTVFVVSIVATIINNFAQQCFVANRQARYALSRGLVFSISRFIPLVLFASFYKSFGVSTAWGIAILLAAVISMVSLSKVVPGYHPVLMVKREAVKKMVGFSFANYFSSLFMAMPTLVLPIMVINRLGAEQNAYFYISWSMNLVLAVISTSLSTSLFAEGSHDENRLRQEVTRSIKLTMLILVPAVVIVLTLGDKMLLLFGSAYSDNGTDLLRLLALGSLMYPINLIYFTMKRVKMQMKIVLILSIFISVSTLGLSWVLLPRMGIEGVGVAWLAGQGIIALRNIISMVRKDTLK
jgi:O-antigen/teichoic acid export membrane protein